jgi:hypothetical protein
VKWGVIHGADQGATVPQEVADAVRFETRALGSETGSIGQTDRASCAECSSEAIQRVEIDILGATLEKDLCARHLSELLKSARRIP